MKLFKLTKRALILWVLLTVVVVGFVAVIGWQYRANLKYSGTSFAGNEIVPTVLLEKLVQIPDESLLYTIDIDSVRGLVEENPWIEAAEVRRIPTGKVAVRISERIPVALALANGIPDHFVDAKGFRIPFSAGVAFDVPILSGRVRPYRGQPNEQRISDPSVREMLVALGQVDTRTRALISEVNIADAGSISIHTTPIPGRESIPVLLGEDDFEIKLTRLSAFWHQVLLKNPEKEIQSINLRYDNQIVTT